MKEEYIKMSQWSKLQKSIYLLKATGINFQIHCSIYRMKSKRGSTDLPRYWITLEKEIIWDYPKDFIDKDSSHNYPYEHDISEISNLIREYIDTPKDILLNKEFENDKWGLIEILIAIDRRTGKRQFKGLLEKFKNKNAIKILKMRFEKQ